MIVVDSIVWIDFLNGRNAPHVRRLRAILCEVLLGLASERLAMLRRYFAASKSYAVRAILMCGPVTLFLGRDGYRIGTDTGGRAWRLCRRRNCSRRVKDRASSWLFGGGHRRRTLNAVRSTRSKTAACPYGAEMPTPLTSGLPFGSGVPRPASVILPKSIA